MAGDIELNYDTALAENGSRCNDRCFCGGETCFSPFSGAYLAVEIVVRLCLVAMTIGFSKMSPFQRRVYGINWYDHFYPYAKTQQISEGLLAGILLSCLIILPSACLIICRLWKRLPGRLLFEEFRNFLLSASMVFLLTFIMMEFTKNFFGRLRPDFLSRCYGEDRASWPSIWDIPALPDCSKGGASKHVLEDGRKSFPSGHSAFSFAIYGYLALFFYRKFSQTFNSGSLRLAVPFSLILVAIYVSLTRVQDYRHAPSDVLGGAVLGSVVAIFVWKFYDDALKQAYVLFILQRNRNRGKGLCGDPLEFKRPMCGAYEDAMVTKMVDTWRRHSADKDEHDALWHPPPN